MLEIIPPAQVVNEPALYSRRSTNLDTCFDRTSLLKDEGAAEAFANRKRLPRLQQHHVVFRRFQDNSAVRGNRNGRNSAHGRSAFAPIDNVLFGKVRYRTADARERIRGTGFISNREKQRDVATDLDSRHPSISNRQPLSLDGNAKDKEARDDECGQSRQYHRLRRGSKVCT